jgi:Fe2+ transport system protein FeoA
MSVDQAGRGRSLTEAGAGERAHGVSTHIRHEPPLHIADDSPVLVDIRARRADVVQRLLDMGVTPRTLATLLPEWDELIATVAAQRSR